MKYLIYMEGIHKTPAIVRTAELMDKFFEGEPSEITSGLRTPIEQLTIILQKMARHKLEDMFPEVKKSIGAGVEHIVHIPEINRDLFWWQRVWSQLLHIGDIVNPPVPAEVMFDYFRPGSAINKKGEIIMISPHQRGLALDIGGGANLLTKAERIMKAFQSGECFIKSFLIERINNCVHCDLIQIGV